MVGDFKKVLILMKKINMKQLLLNWLLKDITRFEVINHENQSYKIGRLVNHNAKNTMHYVNTYQLLSSLQDDNRTLKIFI